MKGEYIMRNVTDENNIINMSGTAANGENPDDADETTANDLDLIDLNFERYMAFLTEEDLNVTRELLEKIKKEMEKEEKEILKCKDDIERLLNIIISIIEKEKEDQKKLEKFKSKLKRLRENLESEQECKQDDMDDDIER